MIDLSILLVIAFGVAALVGALRWPDSGAGTVLLVVLASAIPVVVGVFELTQATAGAGMVAVGCYLAIIGRIMQAERHRRQTDRREGDSEDAAWAKENEKLHSPVPAWKKR